MTSCGRSYGGRMEAPAVLWHQVFRTGAPQEAGVDSVAHVLRDLELQERGPMALQHRISCWKAATCHILTHHTDSSWDAGIQNEYPTGVQPSFEVCAQRPEIFILICFHFR